MSGSRLALVAAIALAGCKKSQEAPPKPAAQPKDAAVANVPPTPADAAAPADTDYTWYRVEATASPGAVVPFIIGVHHDRPEGVIWTAEERLPLVVEQRTPSLLLRIPVRGAKLTLDPVAGSEKMTGQWLVEFYFKQDFPITAEPIAAPTPEALFPGDEAPGVDVSGSWRFNIKEFGVSRGILRQDAHGTVTGTVIPPDVGDLRYLTGRVQGNKVRLSVFDGIHGYGVEMTASDQGKKLTGRWIVTGIGTFALTATRDTPPETHLKVSPHMAPGKTRLSLPALDQPPYAGNPVIVDYFGSWCPVCLDLTPELVRMYKQHAGEGLQVLSIALEPGDEAEAKRRLDEFRAEFDVPWPFTITYTDDFAAAFPPEVKDAMGFPLTIFLRRDHTVAAIHNGFVSKAAGPEHDAVLKVLEGYVAEIVASSPAGSAAPAAGSGSAAPH